jgi:glycerophosphoryl diester phosphodiesterase
MDTVKIDKKGIKMVAHRGVSGLECENTCAAFIAAGNRSYSGIETDVHVTADGQFVVIHDFETGRVSETNIPVDESTRAELSAIRLYSNPWQKTPGRSDLVIPDLSDYVRICHHYDKVAVLELKGDISEENVGKIVDVVKQYDHLEQTLFISFWWDNLVKLRKLLPEQPMQFLTGKWTEELPQNLKFQNFGLDIYYPELTKERVEQIHSLGLEVNCWTCDSVDAATDLIEMGVDCITSNILE